MMFYKGERVFRYVFENIPQPKSFFLEINGTALTCVYLPQFSKTRVYCMGNSPYKKPIEVRMGWRTADGQTVEVYVDPDLIARMNKAYQFPMGKPPAMPTPAPGGGEPEPSGGYPYP